jgi:hypothetical protein
MSKNPKPSDVIVGRVEFEEKQFTCFQRPERGRARRPEIDFGYFRP